MTTTTEPMRNMIVVATFNGRIRLKHIEFIKDKHTVVGGILYLKATMKNLGEIKRCYSEPIK